MYRIDFSVAPLAERTAAERERAERDDAWRAAGVGPERGAPRKLRTAAERAQCDAWWDALIPKFARQYGRGGESRAAAEPQPDPRTDAERLWDKQPVKQRTRLSGYGSKPISWSPNDR